MAILIPVSALFLFGLGIVIYDWYTRNKNH